MLSNYFSKTVLPFITKQLKDSDVIRLTVEQIKLRDVYDYFANYYYTKYSAVPGRDFQEQGPKENTYSVFWSALKMKTGEQYPVVFVEYSSREVESTDVDVYISRTAAKAVALALQKK